MAIPFCLKHIYNYGVIKRLLSTRYFSSFRSFSSFSPVTRALLILFLAATLTSILDYNGHSLKSDDVKYMSLVRGLASGKTVGHSLAMKKAFAENYPCGFPIALMSLYPALRSNFSWYNSVTMLARIGLVIAFFWWLGAFMGPWPALLFSFALSLNPVVRLWSMYVYTDIPFTFLLVAIFAIHTRMPRYKFLVPLLLVILVSIRTAGIAIWGGYALVYLYKKEYRPLIIMSIGLALYLILNLILFGMISGISMYLKVSVAQYPSTEATLIGRIFHNFRSTFGTLLPSSLFFSAYGRIPPSIIKFLLLIPLSLLACAAFMWLTRQTPAIGVSLVLYTCLIFFMQPIDLVRRLILPLIPALYISLVILWKDKRRKILVTGIIALIVADSLIALPAYSRMFSSEPWPEITNRKKLDMKH